MHILRILLDTVLFWLECFWKIAVTFGSHLGLGEAIVKLILVFLIIAILKADPFSVSRNDRKNKQNGVSIFVDIISNLRK